MRRGRRIYGLAIAGLAAAAALGIYWLVATAPEPVTKGHPPSGCA